MNKIKILIFATVVITELFIIFYIINQNYGFIIIYDQGNITDVVEKYIQEKLYFTDFSNIFSDEAFYEENNPIADNRFGFSENFKTSYKNNYGGVNSWSADINKYGYRFNDSIDNSSKIIILIGDSHSFGWGLNDDNIYSYKLENLLNNDLYAKKWGIINLAMPGENLIQKIKRFKKFIDIYSPEFVVVQYDSDDYIPVSAKGFEGDMSEEFQKRTASWGSITSTETNFNLLNLFINFRGEVKKIISDPLDEAREKYLRELYEFQTQKNFSVIIMSTWMDEYEDKILKSICSKYGWTYVNADNEILENNDYALSIYEPHFNSEAHTLIAEHLFEIIKSMES